MSKAIYIYGIIDPRYNSIRYIGKSANPKRRMWEHIRDAKNGVHTYKHKWLKLLLENGIEPKLIILEVTDEENWQEVERQWIAKYSEVGSNLTNLTRGGDGLIGYHHSDEAKEKIRQASLERKFPNPHWKGKKQSPEHIQKRVEARKQNNTYKHTDETKAKISQKNTGKNLGNTHTLGHKLTEEHKEKLRQKLSGKNNPNYGKPMSAATKAKLSKVKTGKKHSEETKRKMSESHQKCKT